ncbi:MAG TPA: tetratricopeptide repeat protein [Desulfobacterales bacterium]|nr:tetratricopeptide repeat protein [Deltaproteobacteria bacterium]HGY12177.1 tetratricopeptide repeat protein [Desulfobacterales bacterium]
MAEQRVSNERKKELEQLDPFQENLLKVLSYGKEYKKQLILIVGALVLVIVVFSGVMYSFQKAENTAAILVSQVLTQYAEANDPDKGYLKIKDDVKTIFTDYANTIAGKRAKVEFAKICYEASEFDESYHYYKEALEIFKNEALMKNFLLASLGHVSIARKEFEEAKKYFLQIEKGETGLLKDEARFSLAMLYEVDNNTAESKKMYDKIVTDYESSMYKPIAESKLNEMK